MWWVNDGNWTRTLWIHNPLRPWSTWLHLALIQLKDFSFFLFIIILFILTSRKKYLWNFFIVFETRERIALWQEFCFRFKFRAWAEPVGCTDMARHTLHLSLPTTPCSQRARHLIPDARRQLSAPHARRAPSAQAPSPAYAVFGPCSCPPGHLPPPS